MKEMALWRRLNYAPERRAGYEFFARANLVLIRIVLEGPKSYHMCLYNVFDVYNVS